MGNYGRDRRARLWLLEVETQGRDFLRRAYIYHERVKMECGARQCCRLTPPLGAPGPITEASKAVQESRPKSQIGEGSAFVCDQWCGDLHGLRYTTCWSPRLDERGELPGPGPDYPSQGRPRTEILPPSQIKHSPRVMWVNHNDQEACARSGIMDFPRARAGLHQKGSRGGQRSAMQQGHHRVVFSVVILLTEATKTCCSRIRVGLLDAKP